ncbi:hypothetical protein BWI97_14295 [Siphonobacter sp. BAB-5405]|uniref:hypothetical protein n=1 Tax=Siphonobacter sp. BAB-5405 TaxID=1864825 RepID=UPI000C7FA7B2|nr:hypothetical protein [Siphonobacter sp. BAB-5405]PMD95522.1 hypothetical protein BWI97_14295 [Siphonobacter sp. BAB-5405]
MATRKKSVTRKKATPRKKAAPKKKTTVKKAVSSKQSKVMTEMNRLLRTGATKSRSAAMKRAHAKYA